MLARGIGENAGVSSGDSVVLGTSISMVAVPLSSHPNRLLRGSGTPSVMTLAISLGTSASPSGMLVMSPLTHGTTRNSPGLLCQQGSMNNSGSGPCDISTISRVYSVVRVASG